MKGADMMFTSEVQVKDLNAERIFDIDLTNDGAFLAIASLVSDHSPPVQIVATHDGRLCGEYGQGSSLGCGVAIS